MLVDSRRGRLSFLALAFLALGIPAGARGTGLVIGDGASLRLGDGTVRLGCDDLILAPGATLAGEGGRVELGGSWIGGGFFEPGFSAVIFEDRTCTPNLATVSGDQGFFDLEAVSTSGKEIQFEAGSTQTVANSVAFTGSPGQLLGIRSTVPGQEAYLDLLPAGFQLVDYVDVADNHATGQLMAPGTPAQYHSIDSGNTDRWFTTLVEIPTLSEWGQIVLMCGLLTLGLWFLRARNAAFSRR
jgi:hypothetical protein